MLKKSIKKIYHYYFKSKKAKKSTHVNKVKDFLENGQIPWSEGYAEHKEASIIKNISDTHLLSAFENKILPKEYGYRLDERIVEYPWIFSNLKSNQSIFLDAGSTFNFDYLLNTEIVSKKEKYIYTYYPEDLNFIERRISYIYGDLRSLPFKDNFFEEIVCQSTIEHIDMDNSMYGYELESTIDVVTSKSYEYLKVIDELLRVLKEKGQFLLTFPYGKFENHGFFQQFDEEMVKRITDRMDALGIYESTFFNYLPDGWIFSNQKDCNDSESFNPHTQKGKKDDYAAHSRAICCIKFIKK